MLKKVRKTHWNNAFCALFMELLAGLEPATYWLRISCSTNWATIALRFRTLELYHKEYPPSIQIPCLICNMQHRRILRIVLLQVFLQFLFGAFVVLTPIQSTHPGSWLRVSPNFFAKIRHYSLLISCISHFSALFFQKIQIFSIYLKILFYFNINCVILTKIN